MADRITFEEIPLPSNLQPSAIIAEDVFFIYRGEERVGTIKFPGGYVTYDNISPWSITRAARREFGSDVELQFSDYKRGIEKRGHREYNY